MKPTLPTPKPRTYPLDAPADDPRFSFGLALDVAAVLTKHGYPELASGLDVVALEQALFGFLYRPVSASLGNTVEYGHDRIDHGDAATPVPATVDGHPEFTGRATVPDPGRCGWMTPSGPCALVLDHPLFPLGPREDSGHISQASADANRARLAERDVPTDGGGECSPECVQSWPKFGGEGVHLPGCPNGGQ
jgi:hypothetical protein